MSFKLTKTLCEFGVLFLKNLICLLFNAFKSEREGKTSQCIFKMFPGTLVSIL